MHFVFIEDSSESVEALKIVLERKKVRSSVVMSGEQALALCEDDKKITSMVANPHSVGMEMKSFLQSTSRANVPVIIYDHIDELVSVAEYPSHVVQVIPKNSSVAIVCLQLIYLGRQLVKQQMLENRHTAVSNTLGLEKDLSKVVNVYSTILDMSYNKVGLMIRDYARRNRISMSQVVELHLNYLSELNDTEYALSIKDCPVEAPILRELTIGNRTHPKKGSNSSR